MSAQNQKQQQENQIGQIHVYYDVTLYKVVENTEALQKELNKVMPEIVGMFTNSSWSVISAKPRFEPEAAAQQSQATGEGEPEEEEE